MSDSQGSTQTALKTPATVFIGLGANLGNPEQQIKVAVEQLQQIDGLSGLRLSPLYESEPMGEVAQERFINAVAEIQCNLQPLELLDALQLIEKQLGRTLASEDGYVRWGPRPIDLDILLYSDLQLSTERLTIPHSGIADRSFVLLPLLDLAPKLFIPGHGSIESCVKTCESFGIRRLQ